MWMICKKLGRLDTMDTYYIHSIHFYAGYILISFSQNARNESNNGILYYYIFWVEPLDHRLNFLRALFLLYTLNILGPKGATVNSHYLNPYYSRTYCKNKDQTQKPSNYRHSSYTYTTKYIPRCLNYIFSRSLNCFLFTWQLFYNMPIFFGAPH